MKYQIVIETPFSSEMLEAMGGEAPRGSFYLSGGEIDRLMQEYEADMLATDVTLLSLLRALELDFMIRCEEL